MAVNNKSTLKDVNVPESVQRSYIEDGIDDFLDWLFAGAAFEQTITNYLDDRAEDFTEYVLTGQGRWN